MPDRPRCADQSRPITDSLPATGGRTPRPGVQLPDEREQPPGVRDPLEFVLTPILEVEI
jgi:hypothetical protein